MAVIDAVVLFVISLLIGAVGIYVGALVMTDVDDYSYAIVSALIGALAWGLLGWLPIIGPLLALIAYLAVIKWRYPGGWLKAVAITLVAWVTIVVVSYLLAVVGIVSPDALGVPGA